MVDGLWKLYDKGQLSEDAWLPYERQINGSKDIPAVRAWLKSGRSPLSDSFRAHFNIEAPDDWTYGNDMARIFDDL